MKGLIIHTDENSIIIRAADERKFEASHGAIKSTLSPKVGDNVDFDIDGDKITTVYILRQSLNLDQSLDKAKAAAGNFYNDVAGTINEENLQKAKVIAAQTAAKAKGVIQAVDLSSMANVSTNFNAHNKFALFIVISMFVSMFLPMVRIFGVSQNYFDLVQGGTLQVIFLTLASASLLLGLPRIVTRGLSIICLITVCSPIYDGIVFVQEMAQLSRSSGFRAKDLIGLIKHLNVGFYLLVLSTLLFAIMQLMPMYQVNKKFILSPKPAV